jgi:KUP system potassium uptake protein
MFTVMTTWNTGRRIVSAHLREVSLPLELFTEDLARRQLPRVPGTAVFLTSDPTGVPPVLLHHIKHNKVLHQRVLVMSFQTQEIPHASPEERLEVKDFGEGVWQVIGRYGFMETPNLPRLLEQLSGKHQMEIKLAETSFYLGRETLLPTGRTRLAQWRKRLFIIMSRNARSAAAFFEIPPNRVVELGAQIQL